MADKAAAAGAAASKDELVLNAIFNPHNPLEYEEQEDKGNDISVIDVPEEIKKQEINAVNLAQNGDFEKSLDQFNDIISRFPNYASVYNNRAQLYRLTGFLI